jgi:hypothetical protein
MTISFWMRRDSTFDEYNSIADGDGKGDIRAIFASNNRKFQILWRYKKTGGDKQYMFYIARGSGHWHGPLKFSTLSLNPTY